MKQLLEHVWDLPYRVFFHTSWYLLEQNRFYKNKNDSKNWDRKHQGKQDKRQDKRQDKLQGKPFGGESDENGDRNKCEYKNEGSGFRKGNRSTPHSKGNFHREQKDQQDGRRPSRNKSYGAPRPENSLGHSSKNKKRNFDKSGSSFEEMPSRSREEFIEARRKQRKNNRGDSHSEHSERNGRHKFSEQREANRQNSRNNKRSSSHEEKQQNKTFRSNPSPRSAEAMLRKKQGATEKSDNSVRLNKALASAGICSRRAADEMIQQGKIVVNDEVVLTPGIKIIPGKDSVRVNGDPVVFPGAEKDFTYIMLHKPLRAVTTANDPEGRRTVFHLLPEEMRQQRIFPVGRLDFLSEGLLLLTDDGELTHRLTHPKWHLPKVYHVRIKGRVPEEALLSMREGMTLEEGDKLAPVEVRVLPDERRGETISLLELTLIQGVNRQIRRMCRDLDLTVATLRRVAHGPVRLGNLERGKARHLTAEEVAKLRKACGLEELNGEFF